jgi:hypothetical protein
MTIPTNKHSTFLHFHAGEMQEVFRFPIDITWNELRGIWNLERKNSVVVCLVSCSQTTTPRNCTNEIFRSTELSSTVD